MKEGEQVYNKSFINSKPFTLRHTIEKAPTLYTGFALLTSDVLMSLEKINPVHPNDSNLINENYFIYCDAIYPESSYQNLGGDEMDF